MQRGGGNLHVAGRSVRELKGPGRRRGASQQVSGLCSLVYVYFISRTRTRIYVHVHATTYT